MKFPAPEVIRGEPSCTTEVDIWSLGVLAYELATGHKPYDDISPLMRQLYILNDANAINGSSMPPRHPNIMPNCQRFIDDCMRQDPNSRYKTVQLMSHLYLDRADICRDIFVSEISSRLQEPST